MPAGPLYSNRALSMANQVLVVWGLRLGNPPLVQRVHREPRWPAIAHAKAHYRNVRALAGRRSTT